MFNLTNPEWVILNEIENRKLKQIDIAKTYNIILKNNITVNWEKINKAIVDRWSRAGLENIKTLAWTDKCWERKK